MTKFGKNDNFHQKTTILKDVRCLEGPCIILKQDAHCGIYNSPLRLMLVTWNTTWTKDI